VQPDTLGKRHSSACEIRVLLGRNLERRPVRKEEEGQRATTQAHRRVEETHERVPVDVDPTERNQVPLQEVPQLGHVSRAAAAHEIDLARRGRIRQPRCDRPCSFRIQGLYGRHGRAACREQLTQAVELATVWWYG